MNNIETTLRRAAERLPSAPPELSGRAETEGLVDVAYTSVDSPLGPLLVAASPKGLVRVSYTDPRGPDHVIEELAERISPRVLEAPARLDPVRRELDEYFAGRRTEFETPIDWSHLAGFTRKVLRATARIGFGETSTYARRRLTRGQPARDASGGQRPRGEPDAGDRALPSRAPHGRRTRRLHGRHRAQGVPAPPGGGPRIGRNGEGGIRTLDGGFPPYSLSRRVPSATRPPLRRGPMVSMPGPADAPPSSRYPLTAERP